MKKNVMIVGAGLLFALLLGCLFYAVDKLGDDKVRITPTPKGSPTVTTAPSGAGKPTPEAPTEAGTTPEASPTGALTPTETPTPTPDMSGTVTEEPTPSPAPSGPLTEEQAKALLCSISADELRLPQDIESYVLEVDSWTTMIRGNECYCINALNPSGGLAGMFYISLDGSKGYRVNEEDEIVAIALP